MFFFTQKVQTLLNNSYEHYFVCFFIDWHNLFIVIPFFNPMFVNSVTQVKARCDIPCHNSRKPRSMTTFPLIVIPWHLCKVQAQHNFNGICARECSLNPSDDVLSAVNIEFFSVDGYSLLLKGILSAIKF